MKEMEDGRIIYGKEDIKFYEETWCEDCGMLEPFEPVWEVDGVRHCKECWGIFYEEVVLSEKDLKEIDIEMLKHQLHYHKGNIIRMERLLTRHMIEREEMDEE